MTSSGNNNAYKIANNDDLKKRIDTPTSTNNNILRTSKNHIVIGNKRKRIESDDIVSSGKNSEDNNLRDSTDKKKEPMSALSIKNQKLINSLAADFQRMYGNKREKCNSRYKTEAKDNTKNTANLNKDNNPIPQTAQKIYPNRKKSSSGSKSSTREYSLESATSSPLQIMEGIEINTEVANNTSTIKREGSTPKFKGKAAMLDNLSTVKKNLFDDKNDIFKQDSEKEQEIDLQTGFSFKNKNEQTNNEKQAGTGLNNSKFYKTFGQSFDRDEKIRESTQITAKEVNNVKSRKETEKNSYPVNNSTNLSTWNNEFKQSTIESNAMEDRYKEDAIVNIQENIRQGQPQNNASKNSRLSFLNNKNAQQKKNLNISHNSSRVIDTQVNNNFDVRRSKDGSVRQSSVRSVSEDTNNKNLSKLAIPNNTSINSNQQNISSIQSSGISSVGQRSSLNHFRKMKSIRAKPLTNKNSIEQAEMQRVM